MEKYRLRFADGNNGEVVNQNGVQLYPREIVNLLNRQQRMMDEKDKTILLLKKQIESMEKIITLTEYQLKVLDRMIEEYKDEIR